MADLNDMDLVREYVDHNSDRAFAELVQRHINLVYSVALRYTGNPQDSQDVTQAVFIILAKKSAGLRQRTVLTGWLYETTRFTARQLLRTRVRRQTRDQEAYMQTVLNDSDTDNVWRQLAPLLEEAMTRLNEKERTLVALRFFENKSGAETAALLGIQEWAARKRAARALHKLRKFFTKRGVGLTSAVIAGAISAHSVQAAPGVLAKSVTAVAIGKGAAASGSTLTLIQGTLKIMAWSKAKTAIITGVILVAAVGTTTITLNKFAFRRAASDPDVSPPGWLNGTNPVEYYVLHTPLLQNNEQLRSDLVGTWRLTGAKSVKTGKFVVLDPGNGFYKTFTLTDWSTASYDSDSNLLNSAGGPYTINGELSTETIATATGEKSQFRGARVPFRIRVIGDDYYQMGSGSHPSVEQQWHRVDDVIGR